MFIFPMPAYQNVVPDVTCADLEVITSVRAGLINKLPKYEAENTKNGFIVTESIEPLKAPVFRGFAKVVPKQKLVLFGWPLASKSLLIPAKRFITYLCNCRPLQQEIIVCRIFFLGGHVNK